MVFLEASSSSSSSSSFSYQSGYDVFLSFRGKDTRNNFTSHLYAAFNQKGINTYIDNALERGENISPALLKAIEESRISVIILSQNYASSSWCLDELATILECKERKGQIVLPVFYKVDSSEVRHQRNCFREAFLKHEERFRDDQMKVQKWKTALKEVANLSGWDLKNYRNEHDLIQEIFEGVNSILVKETYFQVSKYPVGIESRVQAMKLLLDIKKKDSTCMVGIVGIGGIGKTTLAKAIYNSIASQFEGSCFLENVRETSKQKGGLIHLQNKLLSKILGGPSQMVDNDDQGVTLIEKRLHLKMILLVLDDVDKSIQLEKLAGKNAWFGLGSRIIITTRDKHLLRAHDQVESIYPLKELDHDEALQLFCWNAFKSDKPNGGYVEVTKDAIHYCGGLPLALTVLASALKGKDVKYVRKMLDGCGFCSNTGIDELKDKCLITEDWRLFTMHDLLQEMGREIVRQESKEPGKRSRLWFHEDGTKKVEGILINLPDPDLIVHLSPETFKKMKRLRLFISRNASFSEQPNIYSNELRVIDWAKYLGEFFPSNFHGKNLVILRMAHSRIKILEGVQDFQNLTTMDFYYCKFLEKIPDVSRIPNLKSLKLVGCENLVKVHKSVGFLDQLVELLIIFCSNLSSFPKRFKLRSLKYLKFFGCSMIKNFPEIECRMECLENIYCYDTGIEELPSSVGYLVGLKKLHLGNSQNLKDLLRQMQHLEELSLDDCYRLKELPSSIGYLGGIEELNLYYCTKLTNFSDSNFLRALGCGFTLHYLNLIGSGIVTLPRCIESFVGLKFLYLDECKQLREILGLPPNVEIVNASECVSLEIFLEGSRRSQLFNTEDPPVPVGVGTEIPGQQSLRELDLSGSAIASLPTWFNRFVRLEKLDLKNCKQLREILGLPPSLRKLSTCNCLSLEVFLEEARRCQLFNTCVPLDHLRVETVSSAVQPLEQKFQLEYPFNSLEFLDLSGTSIVSIPTLFNRFVRLRYLRLYHCKQLREVLELPQNIEYVELGGCTSLERLPFNNIYDLPKLWWIDFSDCPDHIGNDVQNQLFSEGHPNPKVREFECIYPGNRIPDCFHYCKEVSNTNLCEIDINGPVHLDSENTTFAFFAVIGVRDAQLERSFRFDVKVSNINGQLFYSRFSYARSNCVWFNTSSYHSQLKTDNFRVKFEFTNPSAFFKSCGFHIEQRYEEKSKCLIDGVQLSKRRHDDDGNLELYPQQKRHSSLQKTL
ncbi:disease resistance protein RPV1-like [Corylus avellana]|uniref:disease resistance protein RPV1-like n=1 Tax=Corylus avellana TaxID=13451 RepID=UPI00286A1BD1|nr:disease resistance protein RPV1-like [Corylus avellana]